MPSPLFEEEDLLTIQASRKCYWGNCAFCSHDYANLCKKVVIRPAKDVIKDVKVINNSILNARKFYFFSDSAIPISFLKEFTKGILKENIEISFSGYFRLDSKLNYSILKKAKQAKLKTLIFGLETLNFRLLKLINKNYNTKDALKIIKICSDLKFNRIFLTFMLGMPTQTKKELENDLNKLFKIVYNFNNITVYAHLFTLMENTMIYNKPEDFDIKLFIKKRKFLSPSVPFKQLRKNSISSDMAINIVKECYNKHRLKSHINMHFDSSGDISHYMITKKS